MSDKAAKKQQMIKEKKENIEVLHKHMRNILADVEEKCRNAWLAPNPEAARENIKDTAEALFETMLELRQEKVLLKTIESINI